MNVACNGFEIDEKKRVTVCDEGEVVLFSPPTEGKITEIYVDVDPRRGGTGEPSPSNIRSIIGYDRVVIHHVTDAREVDYVSRLDGIVYSGTIDLEKGIVTTEYAILNIDGSKTVGSVTGHPNSFTYSLGAECIAPNARGVQSTGWCTHYKVLTDVNSAKFYSEDKAVAYANTSLSAVVGRAIFTDTDYSSAADFKTFLQNQAANGTPVQMVFRLNEPVTFECDPLSIRTVSGNNHLVSEDGIIHACLEYFEDTEEPSESVTMPFGCQVGCTVSEYHTVEPLPVEERDPKDVCPPGMPNKWDIDDIPHAEGYCEGQGMDCVCNPMAIVTGIPCYKTIYVDSLPEEGMSGVMYVVPVDDKYAVYIWDGTVFKMVTASSALEPLTVTPSMVTQDISPSSGYEGFSSVHVKPIPSKYVIPTGTKLIVENGVGIDVARFEKANVFVPNSYSISDEGKVVHEGELISQSTHTVIENGTYDTTLINELHVDVERSGVEDVYITASGAVSQTLLPDKFYHFTSESLTSLTLTFEDIGQYHFEFHCGSNAVTLNLPSSVQMPSSFAVEANSKYEIDVLDTYGVYAVWTYGVTP